MHLLRQLKSGLIYLFYYLHVVDQHSVQAPYAYQLYLKLKEGKKKFKPIDEIEHHRKAFQNDQVVVGGQDLGAGSKVNKRRTIASVATYGISSVSDCLFLQNLIEITGSKTCIELGTSLGIATSYLAAQAQIEKVITFEGNEQLLKLSRRLFQSLHLDNIKVVAGNIDQSLPKFLMGIDSIDFVIIDANHTERALLRYFDLLKTKLSPQGVMVIDDIRWSAEMYRAWKKLVQSKEVFLSIEFLNRGVLFFEKRMDKQHYVWKY